MVRRERERHARRCRGGTDIAEKALPSLLRSSSYRATPLPMPSVADHESVNSIAVIADGTVPRCMVAAHQEDSRSLRPLLS